MGCPPLGFRSPLKLWVHFGTTFFVKTARQGCPQKAADPSAGFSRSRRSAGPQASTRVTQHGRDPGSEHCVASCRNGGAKEGGRQANSAGHATEEILGLWWMFGQLPVDVLRLKSISTSAPPSLTIMKEGTRKAKHLGGVHDGPCFARLMGLFQSWYLQYQQGIAPPHPQL